MLLDGNVSLNWAMQMPPKPSSVEMANIKIRMPLNLPIVEAMNFDEQPDNYCQFVRQYESFIESIVCHPGEQFLYLMQ